MRTVLAGIAGISLAVLISCSSSRVTTDEPPKMDKVLNTTTGDQGEKVGVRDDKVVIQKKVYLEETLAKLQDEIRDLENAIYGQSKRDAGGIWLGLKSCRQNLADPRIGGNGVPEPMEKWEKISERAKDFNFAVDKKGNVVAVQEEDLEVRIVNLEKAKNVINDRYDAMKEKLDSCENKHRTALIQHGMDPADTKAVGEWVDGPGGFKVWKMKKSSTSNPEELMRRKQKRSNQSVDTETEE